MTPTERGAALASTMTMREALALQAPSDAVERLAHDAYLVDGFDNSAVTTAGECKARLLWADYMLAQMVAA